MTATKNYSIERLRDWAQEHGSDRVKELMAENFRWQRLAREEFAELHAPSGYQRLSDLEKGIYSDVQKRLEPTPEELDELQRARIHCALWEDDPACPHRNPRLHWIIAQRSFEEPTEKFAAIVMDVVTPDGVHISFYKRFSSDGDES